MTSAWHAYLIAPLQPLVFRSGRPFGSGVGPDGGAFPLPCSAAGLLRTVYAQQKQPVPVYAREELAAIAQRGPFLARLSHELQGVTLAELYVPKSADALYLDTEDGGFTVERLAPQPLPGNAGCDLPAGLLPVQTRNPVKAKPAAGPAYWPWSAFLRWQAGEPICQADLEKHALPATTVRTHVAIDGATLASEEGRLFQTQALDYGPSPSDGWSSWGFFALSTASLAAQAVIFGGERRLSRLHPLPDTGALPFAPGDGLPQAAPLRGLRVTLLTPAIFHRGFVPGWLDERLEGRPPDAAEGVRLRLVAVACERWIPVSGWDLAEQKPKAMRKAVAAGAVYWFQVLGGESDAVWRAVHGAVLSDAAEDRSEGFGMAWAAPWENPMAQD